MDPLLSVVICTHNPRRAYFERVLGALRAQTLALERWELIVVDNASRDPVADSFNIRWHPRGRHVSEGQLGLTPARLRGIEESKAPLLVFVDDDNVLAPNYLDESLRSADRYPFLGAWGGSVLPEFEVPPEPWAVPYLPHLALREVKRDCWANLLRYNESVPFGAGMCVRRVLAERFRHEVTHNKKVLMLGRSGEDLSSHEESFFLLRGCEMGYGTGTLTALRLTHLIPASRLSQEYLLRFMERNEYSWQLMLYLCGENVTDMAPESLLRRMINWWRSLGATPFERRMARARRRGRASGIEMVRRMERDAT